jgi:hypothetical protein
MFFKMIRDDALMISYVYKPTSAHNDMKIYYIITSITSYTFRPPIVAIFWKVFLEGILHWTLKQFTNTKC